MKINLKTRYDIPDNWKKIRGRNKNTVSIRESKGVETFHKSWGVLESNPEEDIIVVNDSCEHPCKKDIFFKTYEKLCCGRYKKSFIADLFQVPVGICADIETLEGDLKSVQNPDFVCVGADGELYPIKEEYIKKNFETWVD